MKSFVWLVASPFFPKRKTERKIAKLNFYFAIKLFLRTIDSNLDFILQRRRKNVGKKNVVGFTHEVDSLLHNTDYCTTPCISRAKSALISISDPIRLQLLSRMMRSSSSGGLENVQVSDNYV